MKYQVEIQQQDDPLLVIRLRNDDDTEDVYVKVYNNPYVKVADETAASIKQRVADLITEYNAKLDADAALATEKAAEAAAVKTLTDSFKGTKDSETD